MQRNVMMGVGFAALAAAGFGASAVAQQVPEVDETHTIIVDGAGAAAVATAAPKAAPKAALKATNEDPYLLAPAHKKWALGLAVGAILAGLVGALGFNSLLNGLLAGVAKGGKAAAKVAVSVAKTPVRAVKSAAVSVSKAVRKPGKYVLGASVVTVCLVATVALLDLQWKVGLVVGAGAAIAGMMGWSSLTRPARVEA
ncbi:MAG: hypothetical protein AAF986_09410 [Pseudomonadota bacterium]